MTSTRATDERATPPNGMVPGGAVDADSPRLGHLPTTNRTNGQVVPTPTDDEGVAIFAAISAYVSDQSPVEAVDEETAILWEPVEPLPIIIKTGEHIYTPDNDEGVAIFAAISAYLAPVVDEEAEAEVAAEAEARPSVIVPPAPSRAEPERAPIEPLPIVFMTGGQIYTPDDDEAVAVFAAISQYIVDRQILTAEVGPLWARPNWMASKVMIIQGIVPTRPAWRPSWRNIERLRRVGDGVPGIVGL